MTDQDVIFVLVVIAIAYLLLPYIPREED